MGEDTRVLLWGGLGGLLSGVLGVIAAIIALTLAPVAGPEEGIMQFPERRATLTAFNLLTLAAIIVGLPLFLALYRALRGTSRASALYGTVLAVLAFPIFAFAVVPSLVVLPGLSNIFVDAPTEAGRTALVLLWEATFLIFNTAFLVGILFLALAFILLGVAMLGNRDFQTGYGWVSVVLGVIGVGLLVLGQFVFIPFAAGAIPFLLFLFIIGWKVYSLSRSPSAV